MTVAEQIAAGKGVVGIELGSTRIKAVLIDEAHNPVATGDHVWENQLVNGIWTYELKDAWAGIQDAYAHLVADVREKYGVELKKLAGLGVSAMMHGYLPFDAEGKQLAGFRTWRNTMTADAAAELSEAFQFNIPQRWSVAHLYQAILNNEEHVPQSAYLTTLAGYIHWQLTGEKVMGVGEASGMFPIDSATGDFDEKMLAIFEEKKNAHFAANGWAPEGAASAWELRAILPKVLSAGEDAGTLTEEGANLLDPTGALEAGVPMAPAEGDAGTGMAATNSTLPRTGNVSAGTSIFSMAVLERPLSKMYPELDMVTTPDGLPVAMVHCNNCTSDLNAWVEMYRGFLVRLLGAEAAAAIPQGKLYETLFHAAMAGDPDCSGVINYNDYSGEPVVGLVEGRPMVVRGPESKYSFENVARSLIYGAIAALASGMRLLTAEHVELDRITGHGGFFKTEGTSEKLLAGALGTPVTVMKTAGEGGPWGMAILAAYRVRREAGESLGDYLKNKVFAGTEGRTVAPDAEDAAGFAAYLAKYQAGLAAEKAACESLPL